MLDTRIVLFDLETTGFGFEAGIVQFAHASFTLGELMSGGDINVIATLVNPECPIDPGASKVHGIYEGDVMFSPVIAKVWQGVADRFHGADMIAGFNSAKFDVPLLNANLKRRDIAPVEGKVDLDVMAIYRRVTGNRKGKLVEVAEMYGVSHAFDVYGPHDARGDVLATALILREMLKRHGEDVVFNTNTTELPEDVVELSSLYRDVKLQIEDLEKELNEIKKSLLEKTDGQNKVETPYLSITTQAGRNTIDFKAIVAEKGLDKDLELLKRFTKTSKPSRVIRLV